MLLVNATAAVLLLCCCSAVRVTQPESSMAAIGSTVTLSCQVEPQVFDNIRLAWYRQAAGGPPRLLVALARQRMDGVPERFAGSGRNSHFNLTIRDVQPSDAGTYYCQSRHWANRQDLYTFGAGTKLEVGREVRPSVMVLPPAGPVKRGDEAYLVCLADGGFPSDWTLSWRVNGARVSWEEAPGPAVLRGDGLYSWSNTLRVPTGHSGGLGSVTCQASREAQGHVRHTLRAEQCRQA